MDEAQSSRPSTIGPRLDGNSGGLRLERVAGGWRWPRGPRSGSGCGGSSGSATARDCRPQPWRRWPSSPTSSRSRHRDPVHPRRRSRARHQEPARKAHDPHPRTQEGRGNPLLYGTTKTFLVHFGLDRLADLPSLEDFDQFLGACRGAGPLFPDTDAAAHASDPEAETLAEDFGEEE